MFKKINTRGLVAYFHDIAMTALSFGISVYLRLGDGIQWFPRDQLIAGQLIAGGCVLTAIGAVVYWQTGLYRGIWRYASVPDLVAIAKAVSLVLLMFLLVMFVWSRLEGLPRSLLFINWLVLMALLGGPRLAYRVVRDRRLDLFDLVDGKRRVGILLAGAGDGAELFIRSLGQMPRAEYRVVGIIAENPRRVGQQIHGVPVLGTIQDLVAVTDRLTKTGDKPQRLVLTKKSFDGSIIRNLFDQANTLGLSMSRVPDVTEFQDSDPDKIDIRPINIEDLLGRPQATLNRDAMKNLVAGKRVLITGAGGSIGSELVRQIMAFSPSMIGLLDSSEYALYRIDREVAEKSPGLPRYCVIADVRNVERVNQIFLDFEPGLVFHAAALKHVPLVEENCCEGVATNVFGTVNIADTCVRHGVTTMVQISTDKAINPTNIMGATKRVAEQYCQALDVAKEENAVTRFVTVRFGNVLGSTGSVVPMFQRQLGAGGPLTVTHPDMTRYFMTIREAVELVLLASATASHDSDQAGKIIVLDMGEPVRIMDLAEQMIRLAGFEPGKDIQIRIIGCRPGEKLFEEVFHESEEIVQTPVQGLFLAAPRVSPIQMTRHGIARLRKCHDDNDEPGTRQLLQELVPEAVLEKLPISPSLSDSPDLPAPPRPAPSAGVMS